MTEFPISEKQFLTWLAAEPKKRAGSYELFKRIDPMTAAVRDIAPEFDGLLGEDDWCYTADLDYGGNEHRPYPKWVAKTVKKIDEIGWNARRSEILETLK